MKKNRTAFLGIAVLALAATITLAGCPTDGKDGGTNITINITGPVSGSDIKTVIEQAIAQAQQQGGGANDGSAATKPLTLALSGVDLEDELAMYAVFFGIKDYYMNLDLSGAKGARFHYYILNANLDKSKILSVALSATVTSIGDGIMNTQGGMAGAFDGFSRLERISAPKAASIGRYAFRGCTALTTVNLPEAINIGNFVYDEYLGDYRDAGGGVFFGCTALVDVSLPKAVRIGSNAFTGCTALTTVNLPKAAYIGMGAFSDYGYRTGPCTALKTINLLEATTIRDYAFYGCTALETISLPKATTIDDYAFSDCTALATVKLGNPAPATLGNNILRGIGAAGSPKTITVQYPAVATGYGTSTPSSTNDDCWVNGFLGGGWDGTSLDNGTVNTNVTIQFATY